MVCLCKKIIIVVVLRYSFKLQVLLVIVKRCNFKLTIKIIYLKRIFHFFCYKFTFRKLRWMIFMCPCRKIKKKIYSVHKYLLIYAKYIIAYYMKNVLFKYYLKSSWTLYFFYLKIKNTCNFYIYMGINLTTSFCIQLKIISGHSKQMLQGITDPPFNNNILSFTNIL